MKTGLEWLSTMKYADQVLFLKRLSETSRPTGESAEPWGIAEYMTKSFDTFYSFMINGFVWRLTPEGHWYWSNKYSSTIEENKK